jgi:altronate dehydratase large subunit
MLTGYQRATGKWGFRNHVLILPLHQMLSAIARDIELTAPGAVAVSHDWAQLPEKDQDRILHTLSGVPANPNLFTTIALRLGTPIEDQLIAMAKAKGATNIIEISLSNEKSLNQLRDTTSKIALEQLALAKEQPRTPAPISAIVLGLECGGSDAYSGITANPALGVASDKLIDQGGTSILAETMEILGAEHLLAKRAITPEVGRQIIDVVARYEKSISYEGIDIRGAQPSRGNIEGGLSTLEEKSLGAAKKAGNAAFTAFLAARLPIRSAQNPMA